MKAVAVLAIAACSRGAPLASCDDDLRGVYVAGPERWMVLDNGSTLEAYPLFPDGAAREPDGSSSRDPTELVVAPRVIDLERAPGRGPGPPPGQDRPPASGALAGTLHRRYMRRAERCDAHVPVHVTRCAGDTLELVLADPSPPLGFSPCVWPVPGTSRVVRWRRE